MLMGSSELQYRLGVLKRSRLDDKLAPFKRNAALAKRGLSCNWPRAFVCFKASSIGWEN